jgi:hypothetical protein
MPGVARDSTRIKSEGIREINYGIILNNYNLQK